MHRRIVFLNGLREIGDGKKMVESAVGCYIKGSAYNAQSILNNTWTQVTSPLDTVIWNSGGWSASAKQFVAQ